ncbi:MAG: SIMPL domain-containing protein [Deferribacterales bacterium]
MKKTAILLSMFVAFSAHARVKLTDPIVITDSVTVSDTIQPDSMTSGMSLSYKHDDAAEVSRALESLSAIVKQYKTMCTFNGYRISPVYSYKDGKQTMEGYSGDLDFSCSFTDIKKYESIYNAVFSHIDGSDKYVMSSSPVRWVVSKAQSDAKRAELKTRAIKEVFKTVKEYSKASGHPCSVKDIALDFTDSFPVFRESTRMVKAAALTVSEPDRTDAPFSVSAKFSAACK